MNPILGKERQCPSASDTNIADRINMVMAASTVLYGRGTGVAVATGMDTQVGHIARMIMEDDTPDTPLQKRLARTGKALGIAALVICYLVFLIGLYKKLPPLEMFMTSVSLAVAAIPEGLPAIVTIMLSLVFHEWLQKMPLSEGFPLSKPWEAPPLSAPTKPVPLPRMS